MNCSIALAAVRIAFVSVMIFSSTTGLAAPTDNPADIGASTIEDFEGYTGISIPDSGFGSTYGLPPTGFTFDSGMVLTAPSPNTDDGLVIGDNTSYGCCVNNVNSGNIISGTAFAADGNPAGGGHTYDLPGPVPAVGLYYASNANVTLTAYAVGGAVIEAAVFPALATPMTDASFIGIVSDTPIASFRIESDNFFVYDDVTFGLTGNIADALPVPAMNVLGLTILILLLAGIGRVGIRRV